MPLLKLILNDSRAKANTITDYLFYCKRLQIKASQVSSVLDSGQIFLFLKHIMASFLHCHTAFKVIVRL